MTEQLRTALARILTANRVVVGASVLVSAKQLHARVHVIADALGTPRNSLKAPAELVHLDFPLVAPQQILTARVVGWRSVHVGMPPAMEHENDIAVLELTTAPPDAARSICPGITDDWWRGDFRMFSQQNERLLEVLHEIWMTKCPDTVSSIEMAFIRARQPQTAR